MPRKKAQEEPKIYNRIAVLRAERGLSRQELADIAKVHYQTIGYLERGDYNPSLHLALSLANFFELPVEAVFSLEALQPMSTSLYANQSSATD